MNLIVYYKFTERIFKKSLAKERSVVNTTVKLFTICAYKTNNYLLTAGG